MGVLQQLPGQLPTEQLAPLAAVLGVTCEERREFLVPSVSQSFVLMRGAFENLALHRNGDLLRSMLVEGTGIRLDRWLHIRDADAGDERKKRERKRDGRTSCCDRCDPGCCDCCDCIRGCDGTRCGKPNCHPHCRGGGEMFDCNPCDGDGCGCDCGW